jgi:hypothetical protein
MTINKQTIKYLVITAIVLTFIVAFFISFDNKNKLYARHSQTTAIITSWNQDAKAGQWLDYKYFVNGKTYEGSTKVYLKNSNQITLFVGNSFPILYWPDNPKNNELILRPMDFAKYNLQQPDSLIKYNDLFSDD